MALYKELLVSYIITISKYRGFFFVQNVGMAFNGPVTPTSLYKI